MRFENLFSSAGRDPGKKKFVPLEEFPDAGPTPEDVLIQEEVADDETESPQEASYEDEEAGVPPPDGETLYDRLISLARDERNLLANEHLPVAEHPLADAIQESMDVKGLRPSHRDRRDEAEENSFKYPHGYRGKEHPDKHQKGGERLR